MRTAKTFTAPAGHPRQGRSVWGYNFGGGTLMSCWLRKKLIAWTGFSLAVGGALIWSGAELHAQDGAGWGGHWITPRLRQRASVALLSRDEAAKEFVDLLDFFNSESARGYAVAGSGLFNSLSQKSQKQLGTTEKTQLLLTEMALEWKSPRKKISVQSESEKTVTVVVEDDKEPKPLPLILIEEDGGWGVDVLETYAKWHNWEGAAKAIAIYRLTGIELPELPNTAEVARIKDNARRSSCQSNLKQIMLGIKQYTQDYDEKLPLAKPWIDVLQPYLKNEQIFNCPSLPRGKRYGYAYNAKLSNKVDTAFDNSSEIVAVYETSVMKRNAYGTGESLAFRHADGANYGFLDGHVKWLAKENVPSFSIGSRK